MQKRALFKTPNWNSILVSNSISYPPIAKLFNLPEIDFPSSFFPFYLATLEPQISLLQTECCCICRGVRNINGESFASMPLALPSFHKIDTLGSYTATNRKCHWKSITNTIFPDYVSTSRASRFIWLMSSPVSLCDSGDMKLGQRGICPFFSRLPEWLHPLVFCFHKSLSFLILLGGI